MAKSRHANVRLMIEPNMIRRMDEFQTDLNRGTDPQAEDYINKDDLLSNDIFCIVFTTLTLCNPEFAHVFQFGADPDGKLLKFDRKKFLQMIRMYLIFVSHDRVLVEAIEELLNLPKYAEGESDLEHLMKSPTILSESQLSQLVEKLLVKPENVNELLNVHKTVKFHKINSFRHIEKFKKGELKPENEIEERPSFHRKITAMTNTLSREVEKSLIRRHELMSKGRVEEDKLDREEMFMKIPSKKSVVNEKSKCPKNLMKGTVEICAKKLATKEDLNLSDKEMKDVDKKSQVTLKSNNKSEYNRNILLNYSKGLQMNVSIRPSNVEDIDYNNDLVLKSIFKNQRLRQLKKQNSQKKVKTFKTLKSKSRSSMKKSGISQHSGKRSAQMKSSNSIQVKKQNDSDEMEEVAKNMYSMSNERHISVFNTGLDRLGNSIIHQQKSGLFKSNVEAQKQRRFSGTSNTSNQPLANMFGKGGV